MLGYHDTLDFPNKLESWSDLLHPQIKKGNGGSSNFKTTDKIPGYRKNEE